MVQELTAPVAEYLERVRFGWERDLNDEVRRWSVASALVRRQERVDEILGLQITETLSPRVCGLARAVASTLRIDPDDFPYELYQVRSFTMVNGQAYTGRLPHAICLVGDAVGILADDELLALLGHEFGHCLAHAATGDSLVMNARQHSLDEVLNHQCRVAGELTADRFGLLAVQDLDAAVRLEIALATGAKASAFGGDPNDFLAEAVSRIEHEEASLIDDTHPSRDFRLYATWLFYRSDVFREISGVGPGELSLADVDRELTSSLLHCSEFEEHLANRSRPRPRPSPSLPDEAPHPGAAILESFAERLGAGVEALHAKTAEWRRMRARQPPPVVREPPQEELSDELERRFQELEEAESQQTPQRVSDDLEKRFRKLEDECDDCEVPPHG